MFKANRSLYLVQPRTRIAKRGSRRIVHLLVIFARFNKYLEIAEAILCLLTFVNHPKLLGPQEPFRMKSSLESAIYSLFGGLKTAGCILIAED